MAWYVIVKFTLVWIKREREEGVSFFSYKNLYVYFHEISIVFPYEKMKMILIFGLIRHRQIDVVLVAKA